MASLQPRNGSYRLLFNFASKQQNYTIGPVPLAEAREWKSRVEQSLRRVDQNLLEIPRGCTINDFIKCDGRPPEGHGPATRRFTTLSTLWDAYRVAHSKGAIESNTLDTVIIHLKHMLETLGVNFILVALTVTNLQSHIDRRAKSVASKTAKTEIQSFRAVWNWGDSHGYVSGKFPSKGLLYPKTAEKLPFMTWDEIAHRIGAGGEAAALWECLYLRPGEVTNFLTFAKKADVRDYLYPLLVACANAGLRPTNFASRGSRG